MNEIFSRLHLVVYVYFFFPLQLSFQVMMKMDLLNQNPQSCCKIVSLTVKKQTNSLTSVSRQSSWKTRWKVTQSR